MQSLKMKNGEYIRPSQPIHVFMRYSKNVEAEEEFCKKNQEMEEVGFEPTSPVKVILFSRQTHSATLPLFQKLERRNHSS